VTVVKIRNFRTGICEIWAHKLTTSAVEHPMISKPPMISPQRMLLSSMNELSMSLKRRRGGVNPRETDSTFSGLEISSSFVGRNDGLEALSSLTHESATADGTD
jgi:hypothetical protein